MQLTTRKFIWLICISAGLLLLSAVVQAQNPDVVEWEASYWNNVSLEGEPVLTRTEDAINHDWGTGAPGDDVNADHFSGRWTTMVNLPEGRYRFTATVDDGIRLWVDDRLLINNWAVQPPHTLDAEMELDGGEVPIRVEYFDQSGPAIVEVSWAPLTVTSSRWYTEFFDNRSLDGEPVLVRNDPAVNFDWGESSPASDTLHPDVFSARWRRTINVEDGVYRFRVLVDDGARLWVDGEMLIDAWQPQAATLYEEDVALEAGNVPVRLEYFENGGLAQVALEWVRLPDEGVAPEATATPEPTVTPPSSELPGAPPIDESRNVVIVDDGSAAFLRGGSPSDGWQEDEAGVGGGSLWTYNSERLPGAYNWGQWRPALAPGRYEVSVFIPEGVASTQQARYWVGHVDGPSLRIVDQRVNQGRWVSLGSFEFDLTNNYVSLADLTFEAAQSTMVVYDSVRWTPVEGESP